MSAERRRREQTGEPSWSPSLPLAQGVLNERDANELRELKALIQQQLGLFCDAYKEPCLRRRLAVRMRARGAHTYATYRALLADDPAESGLLLDAITINVSKFFRNQDVWDALRRRFIPEFFKSEQKTIRMWSAGCASGEEPYTLAMVLRQYAEEQGITAQLGRFDILATDIDPGVLELARRGEYGAFAFTEIRSDVRARYFEEDRIKPEIRSMVRFAQLDLMTDPLPQELDLILCRNVVIYFERQIQEQLFLQFHDSLVPDGRLVLGKVETIYGPAARKYRTLATRERIYCRL